MLLRIRRSIFAAILLVVALQMQAEYLTSLDQVELGKYYRFYSLAYNMTMAMSETETPTLVVGANTYPNVYCDTPNQNDYMQVWKITNLTVDGSKKKVKIQNAVSGRWINRRPGDGSLICYSITGTGF